MQINELNDDCLHCILTELPLGQIITDIGLVCSRWRAIQLQICARRHSLVLLVGQDPLQLISRSQFAIPMIERIKKNSENFDPIYNPISLLEPEQNQLAFTRLYQNIAYGLMFTFPRVTSLTLVLHDALKYEIVNTVQLLQHWRQTIISLRLWFQDYRYIRHSWDHWTAIPRVLQHPRSGTFHCTALLCAINALHSLKHLILETPNKIGYNPENMPIFSQLEQLYFSSSGMDWLKPNPVLKCEKLQKIGFGMQGVDVSIFDQNLTDFLECNSKYYEKLTHFSICFNLSPAKLTQICAKLSQLRTVAIPIQNISIAQLSRALTKLPMLLHLNLNLETVESVRNSIRLITKWCDPSAATVERQEREEYFSIPSLKLLTLDLKLHSHSDLEQLRPNALFPNLKLVQLRQRSIEQCMTCCKQIDSARNNQQRVRIDNSCIQSLVRPFLSMIPSPRVVVMSSEEKCLFDSLFPHLECSR